jgi:hypothetical protein
MPQDAWKEQDTAVEVLYTNDCDFFCFLFLVGHMEAAQKAVIEDISKACLFYWNCTLLLSLSAFVKVMSLNPVMGNNSIMTRLFSFFKLQSLFHHFKYIIPLPSPYNISFAFQGLSRLPNLIKLRVFQGPSNATLRFQGASKTM